MHQSAAGNGSPKILTNGLVAQANAQQWFPSLCASRDKLKAHTRFIRRFWPG
jgi:hypothetical protein